MIKRLALTALMGFPLGAGAQAHPVGALFDHPQPAQASFTQLEGDRESTGTVTVGRGGQLRWEQTTPFREVVVSNGKAAWHVDYGLEQAVRLDPAQHQGWAAILQDASALDRLYTTRQEGQTWVFSPKQGVDAPAARMTLNAQGQPQRLVMDSQTISFGSWKRVDQGVFDYQPEPGLDVIGEASP